MKKYTKKYIKSFAFSSFLMVLFLFAYFIFGMLFEESGDELVLVDNYRLMILICIGVSLIIYVLLIVYAHFYIKTSGYQLSEKNIVSKCGVFFKKQSQLEYSKIHSVNKTQGIIQKMFKIAVLHVDSGSTNEFGDGEIIIIEDSDVIEKLITEINEKKNSCNGVKTETVIEKDNYKLNLKRKKIALFELTMAIYSFLIFVVIALVAFSFAVTIALVINQAHEIINFVYLMLIVLGVILGFTIIISLVHGAFYYHKFEIRKNGNSIVVERGFFVRNVNEFSIDKIKAIKIKQNIIQKLFKVCSIDVDVIGYVNKTSANNSTTYTNGELCPIINVFEVEDFLLKVCPSYVVKDKTRDSATKYIPFISYYFLFFIFPLFVVLLVLNLVFLNKILFVSSLLSMFFLMFFKLVLSLLTKKNQGLYFDDDKIICENGTLEKRITIIVQDNLIGIESYTTNCRKKHDIYSYRVHFYSNSLSNSVDVKNINVDDKASLEKVVKY